MSLCLGGHRLGLYARCGSAPPCRTDMHWLDAGLWRPADPSRASRRPVDVAVVTRLGHAAGGWLYQDVDSLVPEGIEFTTASLTRPTAEQLEDLRFAWRCVKHVKSNAITVATGQRLLGMGSGQPNRVKSVEIALEKAGSEIKASCPITSLLFGRTYLYLDRSELWRGTAAVWQGDQGQLSGQTIESGA